MANCSRDWPARCGGRGGRPDSARSRASRDRLTSRLAGQSGVGVYTMETVIAGVDGSETALEAARAAADLSKRLGANLHLVMAIGRAQQQTVRGGGGESWTINSFTAAEQKLSGLVGQIRGGPGVTSAVVEGDPAKCLVAEAERLDADVIVVGNRRVHGPGRVLGAVALEVVRRSPCAVYIVKTT
jgi:nucleotide-binding universal stress UspA family protein